MAPADVMRRYVDAMRRCDREQAFSYYADDIVGHIPGRSAFAGERRGKQAVIEYIRAALALAKERVELELVDMLVGEEHVALLVRERLEGAGGAIDIRRANVYRVRDGKIDEIWIYEGDQYAVDEYFAAGG